MPNESLTPRRRVELALQGINPGRIPFVIWNNKIPDEEFARKLLDAGVCIVVKSRVYDTNLKTINTEKNPGWLKTGTK